MQTANRNPSTWGSALLTVLWLTAALSAIGVAVASNVRGETERAATNIDDAKAYFLAAGAIERASLRIKSGPPLYVYGTPWMDLNFPSGIVHVDIIPETSKLSLNSARADDFIRLLAALGVSEDAAFSISAAIVDWRTADPLHTSPYDAFYLAQAPSFLPPHASFTQNEELLLVQGITPDLYYGTSLDRNHAGLRDCVSVYGTTGGLDVNTARPETMQAVGLSPSDAAGIVNYRAQLGGVTAVQLAQMKQSIGPPAQRLGIGGQSIFTLRATARIRQPDGKLSDMRRTVSAQIRFALNGLQQNNLSGIEVLRWFDRG
jgi:general secretion pathway protein K